MAENDNIMEYVEQNCMEMISYAGEGRALVYEALEHVLKEDYARAGEFLDKSEECLQKAHNVQFTKLMTYQLEGNDLPFHVLILHAMDLLMVATAERDMLKRIVASKLSRGNEK